MRTFIYRKIIFPLLFLCMCCNVNAQPKLCGKYIIKQDEFAKTLAFEKNNTAKLQAASYLIRVYFHICRYTNGTNAGATSDNITTEFATLQADYASSGICFLNAGLDYINSTQLDTVNVDKAGAHDLFTPFRVANCINVFYTYLIKGKNPANGGGYGGIALDGIPGTFCLISNGNVGKAQTISHEVGHCLGLLHTFDSSEGREDIDGSNCSSAGDLICSTSADPYLYNASSCYSVKGCTYNGTCQDPKGATNFTPPYANMMAYWWSYGCYTPLSFTADQFTRIKSFLGSNSDLQKCESPANLTEGFSTNSGTHMASAINTYSTTGTCLVSGTALVTLGGQTVFAEPGFHAYPSAGGLVLIRAASCNLSSKAAQTNSIIAEDKVEQNKLFVYPNPATSIINIVVNLNGDQNNSMLQLYNMEMMKVKEFNLKNLLKGKQSIQLNISNLSPGMYIVVLKLKSAQLTQKVILIK